MVDITAIGEEIMANISQPAPYTSHTSPVDEEDLRYRRYSPAAGADSRRRTSRSVVHHFINQHVCASTALPTLLWMASPSGNGIIWTDGIAVIFVSLFVSCLCRPRRTGRCRSSIQGKGRILVFSICCCNTQQSIDEAIKHRAAYCCWMKTNRS